MNTVRYVSIVFWLVLCSNTFAQQGNFYAPFHWKEGESRDITVSKFGHYVELGLGPTRAMGEKDFYGYFSYTFAYKSHIASLGFQRAGIFPYGGADCGSFMNATHFAFLIGESIRARNLLFYIAGGISRGWESIRYPDPNPTGPCQYLNYDRSGLFLPVESKLFFLFSRGGGLGAFFNASGKFTNYGFSLVFGHWNESEVRVGW